MQPDQLVNLGISVLSSIALLAIISLGLAVLFGMMGVINLAHGEFLMLGAFFTLTGVRLGLNLWIAMVLAALAVGVVGIVIERLLIRHLYGRMPATMLATWGLSLILVQVIVLIYGPATNGIPTPWRASPSVTTRYPNTPWCSSPPPPRCWGSPISC